MFARVHPPEDVKSGNTGSCQDLADYLSKEEGEGLHFFSHTEKEVPVENVIINIDNNRKALGKDDAKFFMLSLNPSEGEQKHLIGRDVKDVSELTPEEHRTMIRKLETFTRSAMDEYARNFGREKIKSGADLMYYARIETQRLYKPTDEAVKEGRARTGDVKPGLNYHVHVIVSRKSSDGKTKLSPDVKSTGNEWELEGRGKVKRGFSHENWKVKVQECFNQNFNYQSNETETYKVKQIPEQRNILTQVRNPDLSDLLENYQFTAANQIVYTLKERGYEHTVRKGVHTFRKDNETFQISHTELKQFEKPLSDDQLKDIAGRFDLAKFENNNGLYNDNGLQVKDISFFTLKKGESENSETLKSVSYKVLFDEQTKTTVSLSTVKQFAYANKINLMKSELSKEAILRKVNNPDLKDLLTNYRFTAANQIVVAMKERGYSHKVRKGVHSFEHSTKGNISIYHKDLNRFAEKIDNETMKDIADRFNLYKFKQEHEITGYAENELSSKVIEFKTYVKEPIEKGEGEDPAVDQERPDPKFTDDQQPEKQDPENLPEGNNEDLPESKLDAPVIDEEKKYRKVLKTVRYEAIYDNKTKTTVPVSKIRHFAYENKISLMDRFKHSYAVDNPDLRDCLQNPDLANVRQINTAMRNRGYEVTTDENGNYVYTKGKTSFSMERRDLRAFTNYAKNTKDKNSSSYTGADRAIGAIGGNVQSKIINEILGDNFRTERMIAGKVKTAISVVNNPANIKMMLIKKIGSFLNPFKEL